MRDYYHSLDEKKLGISGSLILFVENSQQVVVVARDEKSREYRKTPATYPIARSVCERALTEGKAWGEGMFPWQTYLRKSENSKYKSICAIPLFSSKKSGNSIKMLTANGVVSLDSPIPFLFQWYNEYAAERDLEVQLQPYLQLITLALEQFAGRTSEEAIRFLHPPKKGEDE